MILLSVACAANAVLVWKVTDAVPMLPTAVLKARALRAASTTPTAGVPTNAATVSTLVLMLMPPLNDASVGETNTGDAALGAKVNPEQTTVTLPAGTSALTAILMIPVGGVAVIPVLSVTDAVDGLGTSSQLDEEATAVIKAVGNVTVIVPLAVTVKGVDVVNDNVAV